MERKIAAMALVTITGLSMLAGTAAALRTDPSDPFSQILNSLLGIEPKITNIENKVNDINAKTIALTPTCIHTWYLFELGAQSTKTKEVLPYLEDTVYIGHVNLFVAGDAAPKLEVRVATGENDWMPIKFADGSTIESRMVNVDFVGQGLKFVVSNPAASIGEVWLDGMVEYTISTDLSQLSYP